MAAIGMIMMIVVRVRAGMGMGMIVAVIVVVGMPVRGMRGAPGERTPHAARCAA